MGCPPLTPVSCNLSVFPTVQDSTVILIFIQWLSGSDTYSSAIKLSRRVPERHEVILLPVVESSHELPVSQPLLGLSPVILVKVLRQWGFMEARVVILGCISEMSRTRGQVMMWCIWEGYQGTFEPDGHQECIHHTPCMTDFWPFHSKVCSLCQSKMSTLLKRCVITH